MPCTAARPPPPRCATRRRVWRTRPPVVIDGAHRAAQALGDLRVLQPFAQQRNTSISRAVSWCGLVCVDARVPRGRPRTPSARICCATRRRPDARRAARTAPALRAARRRRRRRARAPARKGSPVPPTRPPPRASGRRAAAHTVSAHGSGARQRPCSVQPKRELAGEPRMAARFMASVQRRRASSPTRPCRRAGSAASARAARAGATRCSVPLASASSSASSSASATPSSPRRARRRPSATSAITRLVLRCVVCCTLSCASSLRRPSGRGTSRTAPATPRSSCDRSRSRGCCANAIACVRNFRASRRRNSSPAAEPRLL